MVVDSPDIVRGGCVRVRGEVGEAGVVALAFSSWGPRKFKMVFYLSHNVA
jgi:hypothetical protein